jgi:hypothetical protein
MEREAAGEEQNGPSQLEARVESFKGFTLKKPSFPYTGYVVHTYIL